MNLDWKVQIDRGERNLHSEGDQPGIRRGVGTCHFRGGKRRAKETCAHELQQKAAFLRFPNVLDALGWWAVHFGFQDGAETRRIIDTSIYPRHKVFATHE